MPEVYAEGDFIVDAKKRYDCFVATDLDLTLRAHGVDTVLITGVNTNSCVIATATAACCRPGIPAPHSIGSPRSPFSTGCR